MELFKAKLFKAKLFKAKTRLKTSLTPYNIFSEFQKKLDTEVYVNNNVKCTTTIYSNK